MPEKERSKMGPKEAALREAREERVAKNKQIIDKNVREIGATLKGRAKTGVKKAVKKVIVQRKAKRSGRGR